MSPWFYAIGDEALVGDYTFPAGLQDDPVFRFGNKFVVFDREGKIPEIKTCMGCRLSQRKNSSYPFRDYTVRMVYWHDGTVYEDDTHNRFPPRLIQGDEMWIDEAITQFKKMLSGKTLEFSIPFIDGTKFVGKIVQSRVQQFSVKGRYFLEVRIKGESKIREGWIDFEPTDECPDVKRYVTKKYSEINREVETMEIKKSEIDKQEKKWQGVFFARK